MGQVLVTGAAGFVGSAVVRELLRAGHRVRAGIHSHAPQATPEGVEVVHCDLLDPSSVAVAVIGCEAAIHCAIGGPRDAEVIVDGTRNLLAAAAAAKVAHVVHVSTVAVYGQASGDVDEHSPTDHPAGLYGRAKLQSEAVCSDFAQDMAISVVRPTLVYGPGDPQWTLPALNRVAAGWGPMGAAGDGDCNLIYVDDLAGFIVHLLSLDQTGIKVYNVNGSETLTWNQFYAELARWLQTDFDGSPRLPGKSMLLCRKLAKALVRGGLHFAPLERWIALTPSADEISRFAGRVRYRTGLMSATGFACSTNLALACRKIVGWYANGCPKPGWTP